MQAEEVFNNADPMLKFEELAVKDAQALIVHLDNEGLIAEIMHINNVIKDAQIMLDAASRLLFERI